MLDPRRKDFLTASNFAAMVGLNPYQSRQKCFRQLKGIDEPFTGNEATDWGEKHEKDGIMQYEIESGNLVSDCLDDQRFVTSGIFGCTPDGYAAGRVVEVKCPFSMKLYDGVPIHYMVQVQGQMAITERKECDFTVWTPYEFGVWRVKFVPEYWEAVIPLLQEFKEYLDTDTEPKRKKKPVLPTTTFERVI